MADTAISFGTRVWLADLKRSGWTLTVTERRPMMSATKLWCVEDDFQPLDLLAPVRQVGVLATALQDGHEGAGVFVPCSSEVEAWHLLERIEEEQ